MRGNVVVRSTRHVVTLHIFCAILGQEWNRSVICAGYSNARLWIATQLLRRSIRRFRNGGGSFEGTSADRIRSISRV